MSDFAAWVRRSGDFFSRLGTAPGDWSSEFSAKPPLSKRQADAIDRTLRHRMPAPVREFVTTASGGCQFRYVWSTKDDEARRSLQRICKRGETIYGGGDLLDASKFAEWQDECADTLDLAIGNFPEEVASWSNAFPVLRLDTSDYLGLDLREGPDDPPVVYLSHEGGSRRVSGSLSGFLTCWEELRYVGPDIWILEPFRDRRSGLLRSDTRRAGKLRKLLDGAARGRESPLPWPPAMEVRDFIDELRSCVCRHGTLHEDGGDRADFVARHCSERTAYVLPVQPNVRFAGVALALVRDLQRLLTRFPRWSVRFYEFELRDGSEGGEFTVRADGIEPPVPQDDLQAFLADNAKLRLSLHRWRKGLNRRRFREIRDGVRRAFKETDDASVVAWFDDLRGNFWLEGEGQPGASIWVLVPVTATVEPEFEDSIRADSGFYARLMWAARNGRIGGIGDDPPQRLSPETTRALIEFEDRSDVREKLRFWIGRRRYDFERPTRRSPE